MNKRIVTLFSLTLILIGCGKPGAQKSVSEKEKVHPVNVAPAVRSSVSKTATFFGDIVADKSVKVYSTVPNKIVRLYHDIGDEVRQNDLLADIDTEKIHQAVVQAEAGLEAAQSQFQNAQEEYDRIAKLYQEKAVSQSQMDAVRTQLDAARSSVKQLQAALSSARSQLQDTRITAPLAGVIVQRTLNVGDQAAPQIPLFEIADMDTVKVLINIIERQIPEIQAGQTALLSVTAYPGEIFAGKVNRVNPALNPLTRTASAEIRVPNPDHRLRPGMFSNVKVILDRHDNVVVVSKASILEKTRLEYEGGKLSTARVVTDHFVFVVEDGHAHIRPVTVGFVQDNKTEIVSGLEEGEQVVIVGQHQLEDDDPVKIVTPESVQEK